MFGQLVSFQASAEVRVQTTEQKRKTVTKPDLNIAKRCIKKCRFASKSRACRERCKARLLERYYSKACCKTPVARCLACQNKMTEANSVRSGLKRWAAHNPKRPSRECRKERFASCLACQQGITITELCDSDPKIRGCGGAADHPCCREMKAQCVACNLGVTKQFFCAQNPTRRLPQTRTRAKISIPASRERSLQGQIGWSISPDDLRAARLFSDCHVSPRAILE